MDRPIIFSVPMVRAILADCKTKTRRIIDVRKIKPSNWSHDSISGWRERNSMWQFQAGSWAVWSTPMRPTYAIGDRLWVRETWQTVKLDRSTVLCAYRANCDQDRFSYAADGSIEIIRIEKWRTPIFMPREMSRLTLLVTDVRVQRLQDISEEDAIAEGVTRVAVKCADGITRHLWHGVPQCGNDLARLAFRDLWESLHNPKGLCADDNPDGWAANPWIAAITFEVHKANIDAIAPKQAA